MSILEILILVGLVVFITHTLEAITGFGCTVLALPLVIFLMKDLEKAKIVLTIIAWILAVYFVITKFKYINRKQFGIIILFAGIGLPIGMYIFKSLDAVILVKILGYFIILSAIIQLYKIFVPSSGSSNLPEYAGYAFLLTGGIVHGAFAAGGPLIVLYSSRKLPDKGQFRATMCLLWTILNTILMVQYFLEKKMTIEIGQDVLFLLPFLIAGIFVGEVIHKKVSEILFKKIVFISLLLVGITMVI
ncbi:MAG: sulfite exporter TauE/SafE family protein [Candidatus Azobacteroides sp.]|nr:sulfite exporter TauE/SafE family protein [Candidatus Azobacteroides sp.]